jgi:hypothetical protein
MSETKLFFNISYTTVSTPDFSAAEHYRYGLQNTTGLYSKDVASLHLRFPAHSAGYQNWLPDIWVGLATMARYYYCIF